MSNQMWVHTSKGDSTACRASLQIDSSTKLLGATVVLNPERQYIITWVMRILLCILLLCFLLALLTLLFVLKSDIAH